MSMKSLFCNNVNRINIILKTINSNWTSLNYSTLFKTRHQRYGTMSSSSNVKALFAQSSEDLKAPVLRHLFEESAALDVYDNSTVNLAAGCPGPDLLSKLPDIFKEAVNHRMQCEASDNCYLFQYGPTAGLWGFRNALSQFLTKCYQSPVNRSDLVLTCGATHGLHMTVSILLATDGVIFVEEFTYMIALSLFKEFPTHRIIKIPMNKDGVDVNKFEEIVTNVKNEKEDWNVNEDKPFWAMFYTIPTYHNPTSTLLPPESCRRLLDVADKLDVLVICDDVYNLLYFTDTPPSRLYSYEVAKRSEHSKSGHVISNGSFSKILAPGVRVGWMEMSPMLVQRFRKSGILQSGGSVNNVMYGMMQSVLELGLAERHLVWYRDIYKKRMSALCESLQEYLPSGCTFCIPEGGYFLWIELPVNGTDFIEWCREHAGLGAVPALRFVPYVDDESAVNNEAYKAIRLSIGFHNEDTLRKAGKLLGDTLKTFIKNQT